MLREKDTFQRLLKSLEKSRLRVTRKRKHILAVLVSMDRPVSAADLNKLAQLPESDLVTVYRTMEAFQGIGIVQRIPLEEGGCLFEATDLNDRHPHLVCRKCHRTQRLELEFAAELDRKARESGFTKVSHLMEVYGVCEDCQDSGTE
ncbi:MAG: Fur family transcriptional regulator [Puniceicoccaceae bacterium]